MSVRVACVVLHYEHGDDTVRCVNSLAASGGVGLNVIVVDNGSVGQGAAWLSERLDPTTTIMESGGNLGYAGGNNVGILLALDRGADYVWICNPDTVVDPDALWRLLRTAEADPRVGAVGPRILYGGTEPAKIWFDGGAVDEGRGGATTHLRMGQLERDVPAIGPYGVDYVTGASMLVRALAFRHVGLLPEEYFLYFEETHFNLTLRRAGWRTVVDPRARVWHHKRSTGPLPADYYVYYFIRNRIVFSREFYGWEAARTIADLDGFVSAWRVKVERNAPAWVSRYDELVRWAIEDGTTGVLGPREDVAALQAIRE